jgi:translation initiation factor 1
MKKIKSLSAMVYSTNPDFKLEQEEPEETITAINSQQPLRIWLDKKQRGGKVVTLVTGFAGTPAHLEELGKKLKTACGTGGAVKDGEIIIQGDNRDKVLQWLQKNGYSLAKRAG